MPHIETSFTLPASTRRRNRRLLWVLLGLVLAAGLWTPWAVRHGLIYPEDATFAWPHWGQ